jgi:hypothetical protein
MFKFLLSFFSDIIKQVLIKVLTFAIIILSIYFFIRYFLGINIFSFV